MGRKGSSGKVIFSRAAMAKQFSSELRNERKDLGLVRASMHIA